MKTSTNQPPPAVRPSLPAHEIACDARKLLEDETRLLLSQAGYRVFTFIRHEAPALFHELARQRELSFRASGQGSGTDFDETPEDAYYTQLVLWDEENSRLIGAYRIGFSHEVIPAHGLGGLYLSHMFDFTSEFFTHTGPAIELTRSFVVPDRQRDPLALAMLWQGLGLFTVRHPAVRSLYGSVTISAHYTPKSRDLLVSWLTNHRLHPGTPLARPHAPYIPTTPCDGLSPHIDSPKIDSLRPQLRDSAGNPLPVPPLIRHYLPLGAAFHAFHREASFGDAIYCLLDVRLEQLPPAHRRRFLGIG